MLIGESCAPSGVLACKCMHASYGHHGHDKHIALFAYLAARAFLSGRHRLLSNALPKVCPKAVWSGSFFALYSLSNVSYMSSDKPSRLRYVSPCRINPMCMLNRCNAVDFSPAIRRSSGASGCHTACHTHLKLYAVRFRPCRALQMVAGTKHPSVFSGLDSFGLPNDEACRPR